MKSANIFGVSLISFWIAIVLTSLLPIKDSITNLAILAVLAFIFPSIFGLLADRDKLF